MKSPPVLKLIEENESKLAHTYSDEKDTNNSTQIVRHSEIESYDNYSYTTITDESHSDTASENTQVLTVPCPTAQKRKIRRKRTKQRRNASALKPLF